MFEVQRIAELPHLEEGIIEKYIEAFLLSLDIRESSKQTYKRQLKEFLSWFKTCKKTHPMRQDIIAYKDFLREVKELSALTIGGYLTAIKRFFDWLEHQQIYPNIARSVRGPKRKPGFRKDALSIDQVKKLLDAIDCSTLQGKRDYAIINLMVRTGLRTIEIIRATKEDIATFSGVQVLWIHGKGRDSKDEFVVLTQKTLDPIGTYLRARGIIKEAASLFASCSTKNFGKRLTTRSISRIVKERLKLIGINDARITAHSLRHTAITMSLLAGATPQEARALARHSDINTTMIYAHNIQRIANAPEHKIDNLF
jgi:integrase/recombinase XerC/integrase/recombinase XerD